MSEAFAGGSGGREPERQSRARPKRWLQKHPERRGGADARGRLRFGRGGERGAGNLRDEETTCGGPHCHRDALISTDGPQDTILKSIVSTSPAVRASAVALGAHVGGEVESPDRRDTYRIAPRPGSAVHRTGRSNSSRERSVRASPRVVSWCHSCGGSRLKACRTEPECQAEPSAWWGCDDGSHLMRLPTEVPGRLLPVPYGTGCILLLTPQEGTAGIRRGKWWRRRQAMLAREQASRERPPVGHSPEN